MKIKDYGMCVEHNSKSKEIYKFISDLDFENGDAFCFKSGGDGDNGEILMTLLDKYFESQEDAEEQGLLEKFLCNIGE